MPIYEYVCPQCKNEFELRLSFSQSDSTALCPQCNSAASRVISSFACKTGGNIQAAEIPFKKSAFEEIKKNTQPSAKVTPKGTRRPSTEKRKKKPT